MKQAILIMLHKDLDQAKRLINYFNGKCDLFIHVDKSSPFSPQDLHELKEMPGVVNVYNKYKIHWGGFSILKTEMFLLHEAMKLSDFHYVHLISGADYPLKPLSYFLDFFESNEMEYYTCTHMPSPHTDGNSMIRFLYYFFLDWLKPKTEKEIERMWELARLQEKMGIRRQIFKEFPHLYCGHAWFSLPRKSIIALLNYTKNNPSFYRRMKFGFVSEEIYINTVLMNLAYEGKNPAGTDLRYILWPKAGANHPVTLTEKVISDLSSSQDFFARKVEKTESSELLKIIDKYLIPDEKPCILESGIRKQNCLFGYSFDKGLANGISEISKMFKIHNAIDLGCGPGFYVKELRNSGVFINGYDGNPYIEEQSSIVLSSSNCPCSVISLHEPISSDCTFELVLLLNVGEYIPQKYEEIVLDNVCKLSNKYVIISWQSLSVKEENPIEKVVNPMANDILEEKLARRGFVKDIAATEILRGKSYFLQHKENVLFFYTGSN
ncbi:MAG: beta-1,6-N-acetylglucosaminyltransferase [Prevotella sp.]|nr:beta-1,6-N-acetylglucosaminyltransferase [Prevotella sp.]